MTLRNLYVLNLDWDADTCVMISDMNGCVIFNSDISYAVKKFGDIEVKHFRGNEVTIKCLFDGEELEVL
jgi:hypothetical protein